MLDAAAFIGFLMLVAPTLAQATAPGPSVVVDGTAFRVQLPDGSVLRQEQLPGVVLTLGDGSGVQRRIRIDAVEHDARDTLGEVMLYTLSETDPASG
jgi:hypothetical protein